MLKIPLPWNQQKQYKTFSNESKVSRPKTTMADLQEIMTSSIGEIGLAQWVIMFSLRGGAGILAWGMIMMSYAGIVPDWWSVPHGRNLTG